MEALFVFDMKYVKYRDKFYTYGGVNNNKITQYLNNFGSINMFTRSINVNEIDPNKIQLVDGKNIRFSTINTTSIIKLFRKNVYISLLEKIKKADVVIIRLPSFLGIRAYSICKKLNKPYFIELVGCPWDSLWNYGNFKGKIMAPIMYLITRKMVKKSKYVHYVSDKFLQERYPTNGLQLACSDVIIGNDNEKILKKRLEKIEKNDGTKYVFGLVGSLNVGYKGHKVCIKALALLKDKFDFELHLLGGGQKYRWVKYAKKYGISDRIFFNGTLPSGQPVFDWLDNLDIHLIMSKTEGLPRILVEAMSRALVSIGSNVGGIPELLNSDCIVEKSNYKKLAAKIQFTLQNKEKQKEYAKLNFEKSKEFQKEKLEKKRNGFYQKILRGENLVDG